MKDTILQFILSITQGMASKKFINTLYVESWAFILLAIYMSKNSLESIINMFLIFIGSVFMTYVGGNVGEYFVKGKSIEIKDKKSNEIAGEKK
jgi:hypothetical protein